MAIEWLRRLLGITQMQNRIARLEEEKGGLERKVIGAEQTRALVVTSARQAQLTEDVRQIMQGFDVDLSGQAGDAALATMQAAEIVERYGFGRYVPAENHHQPTQVISLRDLQEHPERYMHKLAKGFLGFPVGLNFRQVNELLYNVANIQIFGIGISNGSGNLAFYCNSFLGEYSHATDFSVVSAVMKQADLHRNTGVTSMDIESVDFLANYEALVQYTLDREIPDNVKMKAIKGMQIARAAYLTGIEIVGTTRILDSADILDYKAPVSTQESMVVADGDDAQRLKFKL